MRICRPHVRPPRSRSQAPPRLCRQPHRARRRAAPRCRRHRRARRATRRRRLCDRRRPDRAAAGRAAASSRCSRLPTRARSAPPTETVFLGLVDGAARFGVGIAPEAAEALQARDDLLVTDLRSIAVHGLVAPEHLPPIAEAKAVLHWHARHRFCANCGAPTQVVEAGWRRDCPHCKARAFPAHRSGRDHAGGRRRALPARPLAALRADHVVVPRRLRRAGRGDRGRGAPRDARGSRHRLRPRRLFRARSPGRSRRR